jgi:hypothetical protein
MPADTRQAMQSSCSQTKRLSPTNGKHILRFDCLANAGLLLSVGAYVALAYYTLVIVGKTIPNERLAASLAKPAIVAHAAAPADQKNPEDKHVQRPAAIPHHP